MTDCRKCRNYYGQSHGGNFLFCAIHPYGNINCPDFEPPTLKDRLNLCGYFKRWFSSRVEPQQPSQFNIRFDDNGLPLINPTRSMTRSSTNAFLMHCYQRLNLEGFEPVENDSPRATLVKLLEKINKVNNELGLEAIDYPYLLPVDGVYDFLISATQPIRRAIAQLDGENQ